MARHESDREDLLAELVTASPRWELQVRGLEHPLVAGIRSDDRLSIYFHGDRCYHFTGKGELRRAYVNGFLFRSAGTTLSRLLRERTPTETALLRHDLSDDELDGFLGEMKGQLMRLRESLNDGAVHVLRSDPDPAPAPALLIPLLDRIVQAEPPLSPALK